MPAQVAYPHIQKIQGEPARLERVPRIRVAQIVMDYIAYDWSVDEMCRQHPYLQLSEAHAAMGYYYDNQEEINAEIRFECDSVEQGSTPQAPPFVARMRAKGLL